MIEPRGRAYLGCDGDLYYDYRYYILQVTRLSGNSSLWLDELDRPQNLPRPARGLTPVLVAFQLPEVGAPTSCRELCPDFAVTARCSTAVVPSSAKEGLRYLYATVEQLGQEDGLISPEELRTWFTVSPEEDGCDRGPTAFVGQHFMNIGAPCAIDVTLPGGLTAQVIVPMVLSGRLETQEDGFSVQISSEASMVSSLHFYNQEGQPDLLDADFGGTILSVDATASSVFIKTSKGRCVGVAL